MATIGKKILCKAAVLREFNKPLVVETIEADVPHENEVRVKIAAVGLCGGDLGCIDGWFPIQKLPCIPGHEGGGIVESVGPGVTHFKPGDKVLTSCLPECGKCRICKDGRSNTCLDSGRKEVRQIGVLRTVGYDGTPRFFSNGQPIYYFFGCSALSEYTVIPANSCIKIDAKAPLEKVCICSCAIPSGLGVPLRAVEMRPGDSVAIWGVGGVGLAAVIGCKEKGAEKIIGIANSTNKEATARELGCTDFIAVKNLTTPLPQILNKMTDGGLDFAIVCAGNVKAMEDAVMSTRQGGTTVLVGGVEGHHSMSIPPGFLLPGRKIQGSALGDCKLSRDVPEFVTRYMNGTLPLDKFITSTFPLTEVNEAFHCARAGQGIRVVVIM